MSNKCFLNDGSDRYTLKLKDNQKLWEFYKQHESTFWTVQEIRLSDDLIDWSNKLNENEKFFIKHVLAFFASSDGIVNENIVLNFYKQVQIPEARAFYSMQNLIETIHSQMYSILIDTYILDANEKNDLFSAMDHMPAIKKKAKWALDWLDNSGYSGDIPEKFKAELINLNKVMPSESLDYLLREPYSFQQRLVAFICVEGIFFSGSFCAIYWLKNRGLMPGLATANQLISRDEDLHTEFAIELYKMNPEKLSCETIYKIFQEAVEIEKEFVTESLPVSLLGMNCKLMSQYIEYIADRWIVLLGYPRIYNSKNPFEFMEKLGLKTKENFFDLTVSEYSKPSASGGHDLTFDSDSE